MKVVLALSRCDVCGHAWHARYRKRKPVLFFCPRCGRRHPRWTAAQITQARAAGDVLAVNLQEHA